MSLSADQIQALKAPLSTSNVKKNPRGYDYVEGWHAIAEANRIFGFDAWDRQTVEMRQLGDPEQVNGNWRVAYHCRVRIIVRAGGTEVVRDGSGYGSGIVKDIRDAHESAIKEAETDAMKRALMTFGNPFGLALYDKAKANVEAPVPQASEKSDEEIARDIYIRDCRETIGAYGDAEQLASWWSAEDQKSARRKHKLNGEEVTVLKNLVMERIASLKKRVAA